MLTELRINNLALIERAEIQPGAGLNVLTGETGAGKSILIHALGLLVGERATAEQVGPAKGGESVARARVEGSFDLHQAPRALEFLRANDFPCDEMQVVIAREIGADGRSRIRINGQLATAATLRELGNVLVDVHGQHEHQRLLKVETHREFLDEFGDEKHQKLRASTREAFANWQAARRRLAELTSSDQQRAQRLDMLSFQAQEIDGAQLQSDEDTTLADERARLMNSEKLRAAAAQCRDALLGDSEAGAATLIAQALSAAREIQTLDATVESWANELQSALYEIEDAAAEARSYADSLEADPLRLEEIEERLHRINRLKRKYGDSLARVLAYRANIENELQSLNVSEEEMGALQAQEESLHAKYREAAGALSKSRRALAKVFEREVLSHLRGLAMERTRLEVGFSDEESENGDGADKIEFLFSANPGQPLRSLARIASGGEISRVMLALRSAMFSPQSESPASGVVPVLVFDEVDTGIGGVTAEAVGEKMRELARGFQVFCVTHLPQIARRADHHFRVLKESDATTTRVSITPLDGEERVRELARMLGHESETTLRHAREILDDAQTDAPPASASTRKKAKAK